MLPDTVSRLTLVALMLALAVGLIGPASANDRTNRILAGVAAGIIIGAALSDDDSRDRCHGGGYYPPPPPRYSPPPGHYPSPRQAYNNGYRDGFADGTGYGRCEGFTHGYGHGYSDGRSDQWYADTYGHGSYGYGYRPPRPVCW